MKLCRNFSKSVFTYVLLFTFAACSVGPSYQKPEVETPHEYREGAKKETQVADLSWSEFFKDEQLRSLIAMALEENKDLAAAAARIAEARALLGVTRADQFPQVNVQGTAARTQISDEYANSLLGLTNNLNLGVEASYEVDLWGKFRRATEAQRALLLSSEFGFRTLEISLISTVAQTYYQLIDFDSQLAIAERTLKNRADATELINQRFQGGIVPELDVHQAQIEEGEARASIAVLHREQRRTENALNVLLGRTPIDISRAKVLDAKSLVQDLGRGVPAELLKRRPDILSAEEELRASVERIGVATAERFPSITVFGFIGLQSQESNELFQSSAKTWGFGGDLIGPVIDFRKRKSAVEAAEAVSVQALNSYESTFLRAVQEVEDALIGIHSFSDELAAREFQRKAASHAAKLSRARYNDGVTNYLEVLDIERSLFTAELDVSRTQRQYVNSQIQLYRALGGGWVSPYEASPVPASR